MLAVRTESLLNSHNNIGRNAVYNTSKLYVQMSDTSDVSLNEKSRMIYSNYMAFNFSSNKRATNFSISGSYRELCSIA
jgi:hypothetical protein